MKGAAKAAWSLVRLWWANLLLSNDATPDASGVSGTLLTPNASGTEELTFDATDPGGPGVYSVTVQVDGSAVYSGTPNNNGGRCVAVGTSGGALMFDYSQPCPPSESVDLPINTTALANGQHTLKVSVEDAAGNSAVVYDGTHLDKAALGELARSAPRTRHERSQLADPNPGRPERDGGEPHGAAHPWTQAQDHTHLRAPRASSDRAVVDGQGNPIAGATLDVLAQVSGSASMVAIGNASTSANGTFTASVPGGPTRTIEIAYRAFSTDASYAAVAKIAEAVEAGVKLAVSPHRTGSEGTITLNGQVLGPVPAQGVAVELLVHYRGRWEPFRVPQTDSRGRFEVVYEFQGGIGRFPFRASVLGGQTGFPFAHGESRPVDVTTN